MATKPRGYVKTGEVSDKHNFGRMPKEKVGHPFTGVNKFARASRKLQEDDTTDAPFLPDRGKGMIYHQKPQHRLPGEQSLKESNLEVQLLPDLYKGEAGKEKALKVMEDARRKSVKRAGDKNRTERLKKQKGLKKGGRVGKGKTKTQGINRSKRTGFSGRGAGVALRGF
jgi:hypothetical protein